MDDIKIIEIQHCMEKTEENMENVLKYIAFVETMRPLTNFEETLKNYCIQMRGIASNGIVMIDMETGGQHESHR